MEKSSREWFDEAYKYCTGDTPFGLVLSTEAEIDFFAKSKGVRTDLFDVLKNETKRFEENLPSEEDFVEEKANIMKSLVPELQKLFPFAHAALAFGSIQGDIDICLLSEENVSKQTIANIINDSKIADKYPLLDANSLVFFLSKDADTFLEKLISSRQLVTGNDDLSEEEYLYCLHTFYNAELIWGDIPLETPTSDDPLKQIQSVLIQEPDALPLEKYILDNSSVTISPDRGATLPSLILDGVEIFYNDPEKRNNIETSIREGFWMGPQAGPFRLEQKEAYGFGLKQHGFLRDSSRRKQGLVQNTVSYQFASNQETLSQFPFPFLISQSIDFDKEKATVALHIKNVGSDTMPFAPGHHTYYEVSPEAKQDIKFSPNVPLTQEMIQQWVSAEKTIHIDNPGSFQMYIPGKGTYQIDFDSQFGNVRFRTEKDKGFVCVEPVVCHPSEREESAIQIQPNASLDIGFSITLLSKENIIP